MISESPLRWTFGAALLTLLLAIGACAVTGVGVGYEGDYVGGVYEPYGYDYGGWGRGYRVGPPRGGDRGRGPGPRPAEDQPSAEEAAIRTTRLLRGARCHRFPRVPVDTERPA